MTVDTHLPAARERILTTAYELFTRRGIRDVGVDEVVEKAAVAKTTLYRHFPSKDVRRSSRDDPSKLASHSC